MLIHNSLVHLRSCDLIIKSNLETFFCLWPGDRRHQGLNEEQFPLVSVQVEFFNQGVLKRW